MASSTCIQQKLYKLSTTEETFLTTVKRRYNAVHFITIWHTPLRWQQQNVNQTSNSQQTPPTSPSRASYEVSVMRILKKMDRVITAPRCIRSADGLVPLGARTSAGIFMIKLGSCIYTGPALKYMMTSSNGNIFRVTGPLCGEFTGHRWIPRTKAIDAELWCFLWSASEQTIE